ncbi:MAG TPA: hypothetical protein ENF54_06905 [Desulfobacteraceae bacterium]|nr:hypothetical protein [Desulfobacteraceae bacterium]
MKKEFDFFDREENKRRLWIFLYATCVFTLFLDLIFPREGVLGFDSFFGFYAIMGFISCALLILISKLLGIILKVDEDYYDR